MNKSRLVGAIFVFSCAIFTTQTVSAAIFEFLFTGQYTLVDPVGAVLDNDPFSSTFTYNSNLGAGSSAAGLSIDHFDTFGNTATIYDISLELVSGSLVLGNMLADWSANFGVPLSTVWNASGMINAILFGLQEGDVISGTDLIRDGNAIFDVGMRLVAAISLLWAAALGQATPDSVAIPEPSILVLLGAGVIALFISRRRK
jgi:hypothetical protein